MRRVSKVGGVDIRELALIGATARLAELNAERQAILRAFPGLSRGDGAVAATEVSTDSARAAPRPRNISAAGRKRIADAARRRWAEWRKHHRES